MIEKKKDTIVSISLIIIFIILVMILLSQFGLFKSKTPIFEYISFNHQELGIKVDESYQLSLLLYPNNVTSEKIEFYSSNPKVATVDKNTGYVTAHSSGSVTITAKSLKDNTEAKCLVHVAENDITLENIFIHNQNINLMVGNKLSLKYSFFPTTSTVHNIKFESSDSNTATVDKNGNITGMKEGKAIITIMDVSTGIKSQTTVTIYDKNSLIQKENKENTFLNIDSIVIEQYGKFYLNDVSLDNKITWTTLDDNIVTVDEYGVVIGKNIGNTKIVATNVNGVNKLIDVTVQSSKKNLKNVYINEEKVELNVGDKKDLILTFSPNDATNQSINWSTSNSRVAIVDNGKIIAKGIGEATITALSNDKKISDSVKVVVKKEDNVIKEESITLSKNDTILNIGQTDYIIASVSPDNVTNKNVTWYSENTNVATVSDGMIIAKRAGSTKIVAKSLNNKTAVVNVKVNQVPVESLELSNESITLNKNQTKSLIATIKPNNASNKSIKWSSSDTKIATVDSNGIVQAKSVGNAVITATSDNGKKATTKVKVKKASSTSKKSNNSIIHFIYTCKSDAILIESNGKYGLIDASSGYTEYEKHNYTEDDKKCSVVSVIDYLNNLKVKKLSFVVATHSHSDHIGGIPQLAESFVDKNTKYYYREWDGVIEGDFDNKGYYQRALNAMKKHNANLQEITNKDYGFKFGDFYIKFLNTDNSKETNEDYNSIGTLITRGSTRVFLASDIEYKDSNKIYSNIGKVDILKMNNHGDSGATKEYLDVLRPENIIVTSDEINSNFKASASYMIEKYNTNYYLTRDCNNQKSIKIKVYSNSYSIVDAGKKFNVSSRYNYDVVSKNWNGTGWVNWPDVGDTYIKSGKYVTGWQQLYSKNENKKYWYYFEDGIMLMNEWVQKNNDWYYLGSNGTMVTGWYQIDSKWYYFKSNGAMVTGWQTIDGKKYFMNSSGVMLTGLREISSRKYYFDLSGVMTTGWRQVDDKTYYFGSNGAAATDWNQINNKWYYFDTYGVMLTGWQKINNSLYYMNQKGVMLNGWQMIDEKWYYFKSNGAMYIGWLELDDKWYHLDSEGVMLFNTCNTIDGKNYCFNTSGECTNCSSDNITSTPINQTNILNGFEILESAVYDSSTLKYWVETSVNSDESLNKYGSKNIYVAHIWVKSPYDQMKIALSKDGLGNVTPGKKIFESEISSKGYEKKGLIGSNSGFFNRENTSKWGYSVQIPYILNNGNVLRDDTGKNLNGYKVYGTWGMNKSGQLISFRTDSIKSRNESAKAFFKNNKTKYTSSFSEVLVDDKGNLRGGSNIANRTAICQVDNNNFILMVATDISLNNLAKFMKNYQNCTYALNIDGGGSSMMVNKTNTGTLSNIYKIDNVRPLADVVYFVEQ